MNNKSAGVDRRPGRTEVYSNTHSINTSLQEKERTERALLVALFISLSIVFSMLIYVISEYFQVKGAANEQVLSSYHFGEADQPFYLESKLAYLNFVFRFIAMYTLVGLLGIVSIVLRKPWLHLLIVLMSFISVLYFFIL